MGSYVFGLASCQLVLLTPPGRGFDEQGRHAPCGSIATNSDTTVVWEENSIQQIEVQILGASGGGVIVDRYSCVLNGGSANPEEPLFPIRGALQVSVPNADYQIYQLYVRAPSSRCTGDTTMQLAYSTFNGHEFFQCQDIIISNSGASALSVGIIALVLSIALVF